MVSKFDFLPVAGVLFFLKKKKKSFEALEKVAKSSADYGWVTHFIIFY